MKSRKGRHQPKSAWVRKMERDAGLRAGQGPTLAPGISPEQRRIEREAADRAAYDDLEDSNGSPWIALALVLGAMALLVVSALVVFRLVRG